MKRAVFLAVALAALGVAFAAGNAVPKLKYPWAGEKLNADCGKSLLEWKAASAGLRDDPPIPLTSIFQMTALSAEVRPQGLVLTAKLIRRPGVVHEYACHGWAQGLRDASAAIHKQVIARYGAGSGPGTPFTNWNNLALLLYVDDTLSMKCVAGHQEVVLWPKPKATN